MSADQPSQPVNPSDQPVNSAGQPVNPVFVDRRSPEGQRRSGHGMERRQFANSHSELSPDAADLGRAIDQYKLLNRRRYITYEEMLAIIKSIGYSKDS